MPESCLIRHLGRAPYLEVWQKMKDFTDKRSEDTPDEIWLVEHPAVFTQGQAGKPEHLADAILEGKANAALAASIFHFGEYTIKETKELMAKQGIPVRL